MLSTSGAGGFQMVALWTTTLTLIVLTATGTRTTANVRTTANHSTMANRVRREAVDLRSVYQIQLDNVTKIQINAGPPYTEFATCLAEMTEDEKRNLVLAKDLSGCGRDAMRLFEKQVKRHLGIRSMSDLPYVVGNLSRVDHMTSRILKHIENVEKQMRRMDRMEGSLFHRTLHNAQDAFKGVGEMASLRSSNLVSNIQHFFKDFNRSMSNFDELASNFEKKTLSDTTESMASGATLSDLDVITKRLQRDIYSLHNLTEALPTLQDGRRLTDQTVGNFTLMMRNLTIGLPELVRRMGPLRDRRGAHQIREFMSVVNDNMHNVSMSLTEQPLHRNGRSDIFSAVDGFQSAIGHMGAAFHDLLRGTLAFINPTSWQPILPLVSRPLRERPLLGAPLLGQPLLDRRTANDERRPLASLPLLGRPLRPPVGLLALQRMVELGLGQRQHQFYPYEQPDINPRRRRTNKNNDNDEDSDDSKENRQRERKSKKN
ncbi:uncharacterized protein LOC111271478 isoform X2 [Varroa jacobsoni]|uniref:Uncharacterized protein n=2 Tax=Varroa TaxID=62624 RepID=A0A7M7M4I8_VARDE|nr:uncharacterized protein LOC111244981 [Varroa destructor]XP_022648397.1 uncharacterized protein LOC111244981 [Varroa destructor]XP_022648405.1 uncharacterized protein LOC111244981 [Varroa destructor]XP_022708034.1 uncharacterized protein LOC111271478 isoform X2 [Varroa jacobsoni]XP_022708035.1 uncharacterized protein LOC111271478 isoform X2 [Varroa jacobsoni]XP_022708036.1 uncharacterized protein LOC111271478 isoform X2 [Varroa jacobsoni]